MADNLNLARQMIYRSRSLAQASAREEISPLVLQALTEIEAALAYAEGFLKEIEFQRREDVELGRRHHGRSSRRRA